MPPWEELPYYFLPRESTVTNQPVGTQLVGANPMRVVLIFSNSTPGTFTLSTQPNAAASQGVAISAQNLNFIINARDYPVLTQSAWFATTIIGVGQIVSIVEVIMSKWPTGEDAREQSSWLSRLIRSLKNT